MRRAEAAARPHERVETGHTRGTVVPLTGQLRFGPLGWGTDPPCGQAR